jgi:hypothetical protein
MRSSKEALLTADRARELWDYDPLTGILTWRHRPEMRPRWNKKMAGKQAGTVTQAGYLCITVGGLKYLAHRVIWLMLHDCWPVRLDHRNGLGTDNREDNLREATHSQNMQNIHTHRDNKSGLKGVSEAAHGGRWYARIRAAGKLQHLGHHGSPEEAHTAYCRAAAELHQDFARTA